MARIKKKTTKEKMIKKKPTPGEMWAALCKEYEDAQVKTSAAIRHAFIKDKLSKAHLKLVHDTFDHVKKVKKKMKKFLKKYA